MIVLTKDLTVTVYAYDYTRVGVWRETSQVERVASRKLVHVSRGSGIQGALRVSLMSGESFLPGVVGNEGVKGSSDAHHGDMIGWGS